MLGGGGEEIEVKQLQTFPNGTLCVGRFYFPYFLGSLPAVFIPFLLKLPLYIYVLLKVED